VSEIPLVVNDLGFTIDESADCPPGKLLTPLASAVGSAIPDIPGTLLITPPNALIPALTPPDATAASTAGILPVATSIPALVKPSLNEVANGVDAAFVSAAACSNLFFKLIIVKFCGTPACSGLNDCAIAKNAELDIPFVASANPGNPVIAGGLIFRNVSIVGKPGTLGSPVTLGIFGSPGILGIFGNPGILGIFGSPGIPGIFGSFGIPGIFGIEAVMPLREVTIELAPPVVVASADEKLPELIALATLEIEGSVAIIVYHQYF
jgi:hypothetical protein